MNKSRKLVMYNNERSEERKIKENTGNLENIEIKSHITPLYTHHSGITLVALVVTIIVLLILAGVSIAVLMGDDGILKKAENAANATNDAVQSELEGIENLTDKMNEILGGNSGGGATLPTDGSFNETKGVNTPKLGANMTLVKFDTGTKEWVVDETNSTYSYKDTGVEGANTSEWANAKVTVDGIDSYFVWIPRYAYKINGENDIDIKFLKGTGNTAEDGTVCKYADDSTLDTSVDYIIHPAFTADANYGGGFGNDNGTNDNGISGIWIGKYEASLANKTDGTNIVTNDEETGNILLSDAEHAEKTIVTKPGYSSWRYLTIGNMYDNALAYDTNLKSHMLKNSEWGAVAYLTESKYGRNGTEVTINNNGETYYTGGGAEKAYIENTPQSSTGNVYGIYDLSGNAFEYVASYYNGSSSLSNGSSFTNTKTSDEYSTAYTGTDESTAYKYGDATYETSGWHPDDAYFVYSNTPFFNRGGSYRGGDYAGVFCYYGSTRYR